MSAAIREIRRLYSTARITLVVKTIAADMAEKCPYVDEIIINEMSFSQLNLLEVFNWNINFSKKLLKRRYDICFAFGNVSATPLLAYMSGAKEIIALPLSLDPNMRHIFPANYPHCHYFESLLTEKVPQNIYGIHMVDKCLALVDHLLKVPAANREIEVWFDHSDLKFVKKFLPRDNKNFYAICMGGSIDFKKWPPENYAMMVKKISEFEENAKFILLGGGNSDLKSAEIFKEQLGKNLFSQKVIDLTDKLSYRQSAALLSLCKAYIGTDTGTMHAAAAVKIAVMSTFSFPADLPFTEESMPKIWYPYNVPSIVVLPRNALSECQNSTNPYGCQMFSRPHCINQIPVETMVKGFQMLKQQIKKGATEPLYIA